MPSVLLNSWIFVWFWSAHIYLAFESCKFLIFCILSFIAMYEVLAREEEGQKLTRSSLREILKLV